MKDARYVALAVLDEALDRLGARIVRELQRKEDVEYTDEYALALKNDIIYAAIEQSAIGDSI